MDTKNEEYQIIKTLGEDGEEIELKVLDIVSINDMDYALLLPADEDEDDENSEVVLMRMKKDKKSDEYIFETIEDDDEFEEVAKIISDDAMCDDPECECHHHEEE